MELGGRARAGGQVSVSFRTESKGQVIDRHGGMDLLD